MELVEINNKTGVRMFHEVPLQLYKNDPNYVAPLRSEVENLFNPERNPALKHGTAIRFVAINEQGALLGRIAAFVDYVKAGKTRPKAGGIGFFESVNDQAVANLMFNMAKEWLEDHEVEAMDGNVNFGENFVNWGVLVEGFMPQAYGMPYNPPYYQALFENYGFKDYFQQFSYHVDLRKSFPERMLKFARYLESRPGYSFEHYKKNKSEKFIKDFVAILNHTWADYMEGFSGISEQEVRDILVGAKALIEEKFIWFAYKDQQPVAMVVAFPDVNQLLCRFNGRLSFFDVIKLLYLKQKKTITRNRVLLAAVTPEYQNTGVIAAMFLQFVKALEEMPHITEMELSWVGDYNPRMQKIYEQIGGVPMKKHITYRYLFDPEARFERFTNDGGNSKLRRDVTNLL